MKIKTPSFNKILILIFSVLVLVSIAWQIYLLFIQQGDFIFSKSRIGLALLTGLTGAGLYLWIIYKHLPKSRNNCEYIRNIVIKSAGFILVLGLTFPFSNNYLVVPRNIIDIELIGENINSPIRITWLFNGLSYIPYQELVLEQGSYYDRTGVYITLGSDKRAKFQWEGQVIGGFQMILETTGELTTKVSSEGRTSTYKNSNNAELKVVYSVDNSKYYTTQKWIGFLSLWILCLALISVLEIIDLKRILARINSVIPNWVANIPSLIIFGLLFSGLGIWIITIGFNNRLYADDFGYAATLRNFGYWESVKYFYIHQNGRFMSHLLDFAAMLLGKNSIPLGPIIVIASLTGSIGFLLFQLQINGSVKYRLRKSAFFGFLIVILVLLMQPDLYESTFWTLHALILAGGLGFSTLAIGFLLRKARNGNPLIENFIKEKWAAETSKKSILSKSFEVFLYFLFGLITAGFNEAITIFTIFFGFLIIILIFKGWKGLSKISRIGPFLIAYLVGNITGLLLVIFGPGNLQRTSELGLTTNLLMMFNDYLETVRYHFSPFLFGSYGIHVLQLSVVAILGYCFGRSSGKLTLAIQPPCSLIPKQLFNFSPVIFGLVSLTPAAIVGGYFPERTLFITLYILALSTFFIFTMVGNQIASQDHQVAKVTGSIRPKILSLYFLLVCLLVTFSSVSYLVGFDDQMNNFAIEFDAREATILNAKASGKTIAEVDPFKFTFGTDLPLDGGEWLYDGMEDYYGIEIMLKNDGS